MKQEITAALDLLISYVQRYGSLKEERIEQFRGELENVLLNRYQGHWYPDKPIKGQAFRSLEFNKENHFSDAIVAQVCRQLGFTSDLLGIRHELTLWIDPCEVSVRLGNHVCPKNNQQIIVARFDQQGNEVIRNDLDALLTQSRLPAISTSRTSPTNSSPSDSVNSSRASTPQHATFPQPISQPSMFHNGPLFTSPRLLSPQAPVFQMTSSSPINVPTKVHPLENSLDTSEESSPGDEINSQPERSDTPYSMHSTTSNESNDSGYCGYVESYPYYYKLNRLYKALALQKQTNHGPRMSKGSHQRRVPRHMHYQAQEVIPTEYSTSPPTPTPANIDHLSPFYTQQAFLPIPTTATGSRKSKY